MKDSMVLFLATSLLITIAGCIEDTPKSSGNSAEKISGTAILEQTVIDNVAQNVIVATYRDLRDRTQELADSAAVLEKNPTQANLETVQVKWKNSRVPWESAEGFLFGPVNNVDKQIDVWPLSKIDLDRILASRSNFDIGFVRGIDPAVKGFHTAEYLIFGDGLVSNTKTIGEVTPIQIKYLTGVTQLVAEETKKLLNAWIERFDTSDASSKSYLSIVQNPGVDNQFYGSRSAVLREFVQGMKQIAIEVGSGKLADPMGADIAHADGSLVESQFSWNSLTDFVDNIHSMQNVYSGDYSGRRGAGLDEIVKLNNPDLDAKLVAQMATAEKLIRDIGGTEGLSFTLAIKNEAARARTLKAIESLATLESTIDTELLPLFQ